MDLFWVTDLSCSKCANTDVISNGRDSTGDFIGVFDDADVTRYPRLSERMN